MNLRESRSLKDKRQVVRSIIDRMKNSFNVSVSEIEHRDQYQIIVLGFACVSDDMATVKSTLDQIANALRVHPVAQFVSAEYL